MHQQYLHTCIVQACTRGYPHGSNMPSHSCALRSGRGDCFSAIPGVRHMCAPYHIYACTQGSMQSQSHMHTGNSSDSNQPTSSWCASSVRVGTPSSSHPSCRVHFLGCTLVGSKRTMQYTTSDRFPIGS